MDIQRDTDDLINDLKYSNENENLIGQISFSIS
jgi:hypothetical protein